MSKFFKILTLGVPSSVRRGTFPNSINTYSVTTQNIELVYPYRGGEKVLADTYNTRPNGGMIGVSIVGIPFYDPASNVVYNGASSSTWTVNAVTTKLFGEDVYGGKPTSTGRYHYTDNRFILNNAWANLPLWNGTYTHQDGHSKIMGFAADGYPIYGPYGYVDPISTSAGVQLMKSGYSVVSNDNRLPNVDLTVGVGGVGRVVTVNTTTGVYPGMKISNVMGTTISEDIYIVSTDNIDRTITLTTSTTLSTGNIIRASFLPGSFIEDWSFTNGSGTTLDFYNGRYCVTPDYPTGTYAYFMPQESGKPAYPYIVGNAFFGDFGTPTATPLSPPTWVTPAGFIVTATETLLISRTVSASGSGISYNVISGELPSGMAINTSTGVISGRPSYVYQTTKSEFVVRAKNNYGVADRSFYIDVRGATPPTIITRGGDLSIGPSGEYYIVNNQYVDFQFQATADVLPVGKSLVYYIADGDGKLPPGLTLSKDGRLYGQVLDTLSLEYRAGNDGKYDKESFDTSPYEHLSLQAYGVGPRYVNKTYRFYVSIANGSGVNKGSFQINVCDPTYFISTPNTYPIAPQWMTASNLGSIRSNSKHIIKLETHDCDPKPGTITYDWFNVNLNNTAVLPPNLTLDTATGIISGYLQYTPAFSKKYTFKIRVTKIDEQTGAGTYRDRTFELTILGSIISRMTFVTTSTVGTLFQGEQSELAIKAVHTDPKLKITYSLTTGTLPPGISLATDGSIQGKLSYVSTSTSIQTYSFTVKAKDSNLDSEIINTFKIVTLPYAGLEYTKISLQPLLSQEDRDYFNAFISDTYVFDQGHLYRPYDPAFGVQKTIELILEHGIKRLNIRDYANVLGRYFSRRKLYFGDIKSAFANDENGNKLYEVVYVEIIDNLVNSEGVPVNEVVENGDNPIYPNSIDNMRGALEQIAQTDEFLLPKFMRTVQDGSGVPLGRILCMPLAYCLLGTSSIIMNKIKTYGIEFNRINFDIDRLIIFGTADDSNDKYLLFPIRKVLQ